ncbi:hypothetical protein ACX8XN_04175 [Calditrichota bacterium GD2]
MQRSVYTYLTLCLLIFILLPSCITTNYYTARTLKKGEKKIVAGADNLVWMTEEEGFIKKQLAFSPSLGIAAGLPHRFEAGIRAFFPYLFEANVRYQLPPRIFKWFDMSVNLHSGILFEEHFKDYSEPYFKYGFTISKEIRSIQPYFSYYLNKNFMIHSESEEFPDYSVFTFGIALPIFEGDMLFPEFNYLVNQWGGKDFITFGIGLRASLNRRKTKK